MDTAKGVRGKSIDENALINNSIFLAFVSELLFSTIQFCANVLICLELNSLISTL